MQGDAPNFGGNINDRENVARNHQQHRYQSDENGSLPIEQQAPFHQASRPILQNVQPQSVHDFVQVSPAHKMAMKESTGFKLNFAELTSKLNMAKLREEPHKQEQSSISPRILMDSIEADATPEKVVNKPTTRQHRLNPELQNNPKKSSIVTPRLNVIPSSS